MADFLFEPHAPVTIPIARGGLFAVRRVYCVGRNYAEHVVEMGNDTRDPPFFFGKPADAIVVGGADIPYPSQTADFHHEIELVVAIGKDGSDIASGDALNHVYGYAVGLDMTRRDVQAQAKKAHATAAATATAFSSPAVWAQDAGQPIRLIVPYAPGGPIDVTARALAERVRESLGTVIIDNKGGAGGNIGADAIAKAAPDGLTIGIAATATHAVNPWLYARMPYDAGKDFAGITQMVRVPNVLVMNAAKAEQLKIHTVTDLIAYAKANPAKLNYGSGGNGSAGHLAGEMFKQRAGIYALHIPYRGANPAQLALLAGEVDFNIDNLAAAAPNIRAGKLKALAVTSLDASASLPGVPPLSATFKGFSIDTKW